MKRLLPKLNNGNTLKHNQTDNTSQHDEIASGKPGSKTNPIPLKEVVVLANPIQPLYDNENIAYGDVNDNLQYWDLEEMDPDDSYFFETPKAYTTESGYVIDPEKIWEPSKVPVSFRIDELQHYLDLNGLYYDNLQRLGYPGYFQLKDENLNPLDLYITIDDVFPHTKEDMQFNKYFFHNDPRLNYHKNQISDTEAQALKAGAYIMEKGRQAFSMGKFVNLTSCNTAQDTYLLNRDLLRKAFIKDGYIEGKSGDYGLVRKAVGDDDIPVYQRYPDHIERSQLLPIGNTLPNGWFSWFGSGFGIPHGGHYPTAIYIDKSTGNLYLKAWDLNDYGGGTGASSRYDTVKSIIANTLDAVGSPVVVTTGYLPIDLSKYFIDASIYNNMVTLALNSLNQNAIKLINQHWLKTDNPNLFVSSRKGENLYRYLKKWGYEPIITHNTYSKPSVSLVKKSK